MRVVCFLPGVHVSLEFMRHRAAMLDGLIDRIREVFCGQDVSGVATVGNAPMIVRYYRNFIVHDPNLLMEGF